MWFLLGLSACGTAGAIHQATLIRSPRSGLVGVGLEASRIVKEPHVTHLVDYLAVRDPDRLVEDQADPIR